MIDRLTLEETAPQAYSSGGQLLESILPFPDIGDGACGLGARAAVLTPEMAALLLRDCSYEDQRPLSKPTLKRLVDARIREEFVPTEIIFFHYDAKNKLVNGQHRLRMIVAAKEPTWMVITRHWTDDEAVLLNAYRRLDRGKPRSLKEALAGSRIHVNAGLSLEECTQLARALKALVDGFQTERPTGSGRGELKGFEAISRGVVQWKDEAQAFLHCTDEVPKAHAERMLTVPIFASGLVTFRHAGTPKGAEEWISPDEFWYRVAHQNNLIERTGEWWLATQLAHLDVAKVHYAARYVASCWANRGKVYGGPGVSPKMPKPIRPIHFLHCGPYDGTQIVHTEF